MIQPDFLFPSDLEATPTQLTKVLVIGSCLADAFVAHFRKIRPNTVFDFLLSHNASDLPLRDDADIKQFDLQYVQIPIRSVLTDAATRVADFDQNAGVATLLSVGKDNIDRFIEKALSYNLRTGLLTLVSNFIVPQGHISPSASDIFSTKDLSFVVSELNTHLSESIKGMKNVYVADIEMIACSLGKAYFLDDTISFSNHGSMIYSNWHHFESGRIEPVPPITDHYENRTSLFFDMAYRQIEHLYRLANAIDIVKIVIFDLDNTMWRGQIAEDYTATSRPGIDGWPLGIWDAVNQLRWRGILVAIASKNDEATVRDRWSDLVQPPFVKYDDFILHKINWERKSENIKAMLSQLSLTVQSAVFVDDSPLEREEVRTAIPGIRVIGSNPFLTKRILLWSAETQLPLRSAESAQRESMMARQLKREEERTVLSHKDFVASLNIKLNLWQVDSLEHSSFSRCLELVNKTNQFNTTGKRWTVGDFNDFIAQEGKVLAFSVSDRFAEYGTVGVIFVLQQSIEQFVMSCRVLGMEIETSVTAFICRELRDAGFKEVRATVHETASNTPCRDVYLRSGFIPGRTPSSFELPYEAAPPLPSIIEILAA